MRPARHFAPDAREIAADLARRVREKRLAILRSYGARRIDAADLAPRFLDACLCGLAREEARARLVLGRLLGILIGGDVAVKLGFVRLGDYARERLGISGSEAKLTLRVVKRLSQLLLLRRAFLDGPLSWTKARLLVAVATPNTEAHWLEVACDHTVRELESIVAREGALPKEEASGVREADDVEIDGEPRARFRLSVPGWVWLLFRQVVKLAGAVSGEGNLPVWKAVDTIIAESTATGPGPDPREFEGELSWRASWRGRAALRRRIRGARCVPPQQESEWNSTDTQRIADWLGCREEDLRFALPEDVERYEVGATDAAPSDLDRRLRDLLLLLHRVDVRLGRALRLLADRGLERPLGYTDLEGYAVERLGMSLRKARSLIALDRAAAERAALGRAYESGEISWVRAMTLLPVVRAGCDAGAWAERATRVTVRRLADEVSWALEWRAAGDDAGKSVAPPPLGAPLELVQMRVGDDSAPAEHVVEFWGPISVVATLEASVTAWSEPGEPRWKGLMRLVAVVAQQWQEDGRRHRDRIVRRDGYRCIVPACSSRRNLQVHHLVFRSAGGSNEAANLATLCAAHHLRCLHSGTIRAEGRAPDNVEWELGARADGPPLLRLRGDVYAISASA